MRRIGHYPGALVGERKVVPALYAAGKIGADARHYAAVTGHIRTHIGHKQAADHHGAESTDGMRRIPYAHLGSKFARSYPLR